MYCTAYGGVVFVEGRPTTARPIGPVEVRIHGLLFGQAQLKSLDDVKQQMTARVKQMGGNCVIDFKYGQRSTFWTTLLGVDNVSWYGSGIAALISDDTAKQLVPNLHAV